MSWDKIKNEDWIELASKNILIDDKHESSNIMTHPELNLNEYKNGNISNVNLNATQGKPFISTNIETKPRVLDDDEPKPWSKTKPNQNNRYK